MSGSGPVIRIQQIPSADEKKGLANANPPASAINPYVTSNDARLGGPASKGDTGVPGAKGDTGYSGTQGDTGSGIQGDTGAGTQGDTGAPGTAGTSGAKGDTGAGVQGDTGATGASGDKGDTGLGVQGDTGVAGSAAAVGDTGVTGDTGDTGDTGTQGDTGTGVQGDTGLSGISGDTGNSGSKGDTGSGSIGDKGDTGVGLKGDTGASGLKGDTGTGVKGDTGTKGDTGSGTKGDTGTTGANGAKGDTGIGIKGDTGSSVGYLDDLLDVTAPAPTRNYTLKWNGSAWVPALYNYDFTLGIASFSDGIASTILIGAGTWYAPGITFGMSYVNGPPSSASIALTSDGGVSWVSDKVVSGPNYDLAISIESVAYPNAKDRYVRFTLTANAGSDHPTSQITHTFRNNVKYGRSTLTSGWVSADINGLTGTILSNVFEVSVSTGGGLADTYYLLFAYPSSYPALHTTGFLFAGVTFPMEAPVTVSVTNASGFTENYRVYRSTYSEQRTSTTLVTSTSSNLIDPIYWGISTVDSGYTQANVKALANNAISNTKTRTFSLTAGASEHYVYALPTRLNGTPIQLWINGVDQTGGFTKETVSVTNVNGYSENYDVYYSNNEALGTASVEIK